MARVTEAPRLSKVDPEGFGSKGRAIALVHLTALGVSEGAAQQPADRIGATLTRGAIWIQRGEGSEVGFLPALRALLLPPCGALEAAPLGTDPDRLAADWLGQAAILALARNARLQATTTIPASSDDDLWVSLAECAALASRSLRHVRGILRPYAEDGMIRTSAAREFFRAEKVPGL